MNKDVCGESCSDIHKDYSSSQYRTSDTLEASLDDGNPVAGEHNGTKLSCR